MKLLVINGPNLNMLGIREPEIYGAQNYAALCAYITQAATEVGAECEIYQSNHEGAIVDKIQEAYGKIDGIDRRLFGIPGQNINSAARNTPAGACPSSRMRLRRATA